MIVKDNSGYIFRIVENIGTVQRILFPEANRKMWKEVKIFPLVECINFVVGRNFVISLRFNTNTLRNIEQQLRTFRLGKPITEKRKQS